MLIAIVPLVVCLVGLLIFVLAKDDKVKEIGRLLFFAGLLVSLWFLGAKTWKIG